MSSAKDKTISVGGRAFVNGVMMCSMSRISVAIRDENDVIKVTKRNYNSITNKVKILGLPVIRGNVRIVESMVMGSRVISSYLKNTSSKKTKTKAIARRFLTIIVIFAFVYLAMIYSINFSRFISIENHIMAAMVFYLSFLFLMFFIIYLYSFTPRGRKIFQYHGAEHRTIHCFEKGEILTIENVKRHSNLHPRCGSSVVVFFIALNLIATPFTIRLTSVWSNLLALPLLFGISYEFMKLTFVYKENKLARLIIFPGLALQKITTKNPDDRQIEVAIAALADVVNET